MLCRHFDALTRRRFRRTLTWRRPRRQLIALRAARNRPGLPATALVAAGNCRGFTPEEFQALDFSRMDLSEYYNEIEARAQADIQIDMKDRIDAYMQAIGR